MNEDKTKISEEEKKQQIEKMWSDYENKKLYDEDDIFNLSIDEDHYD